MEQPPTLPSGAGYFEHDADIGVVGRGATVEEAFTRAAQAMLAVVVDPTGLRPLVRVPFDVEEDDLELALPRVLNALLALSREHGLAPAGVSLAHDGARWHGELAGEPWSDGLARGTEVKGATLTMLSVREVDGGFEARCVVDV